MQEQLLAPRVIHFGRHELMWECTEAANANALFWITLRTILKLDKMRHYRSMAHNAKENRRASLKLNIFSMLALLHTLNVIRKRRSNI